MTEKILFLTGKLAERSLHRVPESMQPTDFDYEVRQIGASVAALMTPKLIQKRLDLPPGIDRILLLGRVRGDLEPLEAQFGIPVERGPDELKDLPAYFGRAAMAEDLTRYDVRIFAEITEAPNLDLDAILAEAKRYQEEGADIIDVGCLPGIDWNAISARDWRNCKERKQAEFLIETSFPWELVRRVGVFTQPVKNMVLGDIQFARHQPDVQINKNWHY